MCVPNLKIVALPVCEILRGSQNFEIGSPGHANLGVNLWSGATAYVRAKFEDRSFFCLRNIEGVPKLRNWVTSPGHAQFRANLWSGGKNCPRPMCLPNLMIVVFSVCEILRGSQNFEIGSRTPGHAHLGANLWSGSKNCPLPMCIPNLKGVALSVCEILAHFAAVH